MQTGRFATADSLQAKQSVKEIAVSIDKSFRTLYQEVKRNSKPDGRYSCRKSEPAKAERAGQRLQTSRPTEADAWLAG
jgi:IS30 family transposase